MRVVPVGIDVPDVTVEPDDPPHVLFVGRLSEEKGVLELVEAARDLPLVVVGDGPLRERVPGALGFVPPAPSSAAYLDRAAVVVCPSRREGYGVVAREAMAHGRPVVATAVGGLVEAIVDGESGLLVPPGDVAALRAALERLLGDAELQSPSRRATARACRGAVLTEGGRRGHARGVRAGALALANGPREQRSRWSPAVAEYGDVPHRTAARCERVHAGRTAGRAHEPRPACRREERLRSARA